MRYVSHCPWPAGIRRHQDHAGSPGLTTQFIANFTGNGPVHGRMTASRSHAQFEQA